MTRLLWIWTNICRFLLAATFIVSGVTKAIDPRGTQYKLEDYSSLLGWGQWPSWLTLSAAALLAIVEFSLGIFMLFGMRRHRTAEWMLLMLLLFTPLTLWMLLSGTEVDCGCFGDAIHLSNTETLVKNLILIVAAITMIRGWEKTFRLISEHNQWIVSLYSVVFITLFTASCIFYLPPIDFRPYRVGNNLSELLAQGTDDGTQFETYFLMSKDGEEREFTTAEYPDSTWTYISSRTEQVREGNPNGIFDFAITEVPSGQDITFDILNHEGYTFLLVMPTLEDADATRADQINDLYDYALDHSIPFMALTSSTSKDIQKWRDETGAEYDFGQVDPITLKTMIRSNPGLILLKDGTVVGKWSKNDLPLEAQLTGDPEKVPVLNQPIETMWWTLLRGILLWYILPLILVVIADRCWTFYRLKHKKQ